MSTWSWSKLSSIKWEDAWCERIAGNPNAVIEHIKGGKTIRIIVYTDSEDDANFLKNYFGGSVRAVKTQEWLSSQKNNRPPLRIRSNLVITEKSTQQDLKELQKEYPKRSILSIPAEMAFGTGDHATTSTCLRLLCDFAKKNKTTHWNITDIGCGTAVLALAALKLGASHATAFDFDPIAIDVAKSNAIRNNCLPDRLELFQADVFTWQPSEKNKADLVVANLFSSILQQAFPVIIKTMKPDAELIISGILATQWEETKKAAEKQGLTFSQIIKKGKWITAQASMR